MLFDSQHLEFYGSLIGQQCIYILASSSFRILWLFDGSIMHLFFNFILGTCLCGEDGSLIPEAVISSLTSF
jgi:hypothetical protein